MVARSARLARQRIKRTRWGVLTTFGERMLPHPWAIDQNFYFLVKFPPLARTPPPHGVYIDRCIMISWARCEASRATVRILFFFTLSFLHRKDQFTVLSYFFFQFKGIILWVSYKYTRKIASYISKVLNLIPG